ncbi:MAG: cell division protein FtsQ/DivIB [Chitinophagales bacterium]
MSFKRKILRVFGMLMLIACLTGLIFLTSFNSRKNEQAICEKVNIAIDHEKDIYFLDESDIKLLLLKTFGDSVKGDMLKNIEVGRIEKAIEKDNYVQDAETWLDANGDLNIKIVQKQPLARVINKIGVHYYIDENANKIPVSSKFTSRVPVITGNIQEGILNSNKIESTVLKNALQLTQFIHSSIFWNAQIEQIDVADNGEFQLIPKLGDHKIEFGGIDDMENKFKKLEIFYSEGLNYVGWEKYSTIKLDYQNQVVCVKKINYEQQ